jgi:hypothetical protein
MIMLNRTSIAAAALTLLAAATPSFADGFGKPAPFEGGTYAPPQYSQPEERLPVDQFGRHVFDEHADHCAERRQTFQDNYGQRPPRPDYYGRYGY